MEIGIKFMIIEWNMNCFGMNFMNIDFFGKKNLKTVLKESMYKWHKIRLKCKTRKIVHVARVKTLENLQTSKLA